MTALRNASKGGHLECVRLLLDRGAGVNVVDVSSSRVAQCSLVRYAASVPEYGWVGVDLSSRLIEIPSRDCPACFTLGSSLQVEAARGSGYSDIVALLEAHLPGPA